MQIVSLQDNECKISIHISNAKKYLKMSSAEKSTCPDKYLSKYENYQGLIVCAFAIAPDAFLKGLGLVQCYFQRTVHHYYVSSINFFSATHRPRFFVKANTCFVLK